MASQPEQEKEIIFRSKLPDIYIPKHLPLHSYCFENISDFSAPPCLIDGASGEVYTYAYVELTSRKVASSLHNQHGINKGDVIMILLPNSPEFLYTFMGASYLGAISTMANPFFTGPEIIKQAKASNAKIIITQASHAPKVKQYAYENSIKVFTIDAPPEGCLHFSELLKGDETVDKFDLSSIRTVMSGAAPLGKELEDTVRNKFSNAKLGQAPAASAVENLSTYDILTPYLGGIASKLLQLVLLQNGKQMVQERASTSVADSPQEQIQKYYDAVMPNLKAILVNFVDRPNRMLRAKAIECISLAAVAVGKDKFRDDAKQVIEVLMSMQDDQMETDDPTTRYMLQAWARLCKCMGQDFLPYMAVVMPPLLRSAQLKPYMIIQPVYPYYEEFEALDESMKIITLGDNIIKIKISVLEEKATACNMLCCYVDELKEGFFPWIDQVAPILVPLLKFYFHKEVRKAAVLAMPDLLRSSELAIEKGLAQRSDGNLEQLSGDMISALVDALLNEPDSEIIANMLDALNKCLEVKRRVH